MQQKQERMLLWDVFYKHQWLEYETQHVRTLEIKIGQQLY